MWTLKELATYLSHPRHKFGQRVCRIMEYFKSKEKGSYILQLIIFMSKTHFLCNSSEAIKMGSSSTSHTFYLLSLFLLISLSSAALQTNETFTQCLSRHFNSSTNGNGVLYTPNTTSYTQLWESTLQNLIFLSPTTVKPLYIIAPKTESHVRATVLCCTQHGIQMRVRSGGHDYEGLSYVSIDGLPFVILDLLNFRSVDVNLEDTTAWVGAGSTIGELYYIISNKSRTLGFPAGVCPTVGVGGHFSGGGIGLNMRMYGLASDNIIDARLVDVRGKVLDRSSMGEDLFWALRGGGAASFGVVLSWKVKLAVVPPTVTVFTATRNLAQGATNLVTKWQTIAPQLPNNLAIRVLLNGVEGERGLTAQASFNSLYLGRAEELFSLLKERFPELELKAGEYQEMRWIESILYFAGFPSGTALEVLLSRQRLSKVAFKNKSDFVKVPISPNGFEGIWKKLMEEPRGEMILEPLGGKINEVSESETPYPHREGNLYNIQYVVTWLEGDGKRYMEWVRQLYSYMTPYVSNSPRAGYLNYRDLDLGRNDGIHTSYSKAAVWGLKYFKGNFKRLALVKGKVDKYNFFRNEQSIPPLITRKKKTG